MLTFSVVFSKTLGLGYTNGMANTQLLFSIYNVWESLDHVHYVESGTNLQPYTRQEEIHLNFTARYLRM